MGANPLTDLVGNLRRDMRLHEAAGRTDAQLLNAFLATHDEGAFEALVRRHGPMVLGVCRRVLGHAQDAEDAFQATFLVLARKAASVRPPGAVGRWLHGVAYHTALKARAAAARRRARERRALTPGVVPPVAGDWAEVRTVLDEELSRLRDDYRAAVVLCDLEGLTRHEAATRLGWPEGTVAGRLARARHLLAGRLRRRGLALPALGLGAALAREAAAAFPPAPLVSAALRAALTPGAGPAVAALAAAVLRTTLAARLLWVVLLLALGVAGAGLGTYAALAGGGPAAPDARAAAAGPPGPGQPAPTADAWVSLFNGKDLSNWLIHGNPEAFAVDAAERAIVARPSQPTSLLQTSKDYADFHLRFEFRIASPGANSGVNLRQPLNPAQRILQLEVQVRDDATPYGNSPTGGIYWSLDGQSYFKRESDDLLKPRGQWNWMEIIARGPVVRVVINGKPATRADLSTVAEHPKALLAVTRYTGRIALQADRGEVWYRHIEVQELPSSGAPAAPARGSLGVLIRPTLHGEPYVDQVIVGGPAEKAGLKRGDVIRGINGVKVNDINELRPLLAKVRPGDPVELRVLRAAARTDEELTIRVVAGEPR